MAELLVGTKDFLADFFTREDPDVVVEKVIHEDGYIDYNIRVNNRTVESGLTEYSVDEELGSEDWKDDVKVIDKRNNNREDSKSPCDLCNKKIYDCVDCENNLFNKILNS